MSKDPKWQADPGFLIAYCPFLQEQGQEPEDSLVVLLAQAGGSQLQAAARSLYEQIVVAERQMLPNYGTANVRILKRHTNVLAAFDFARAQILQDPKCVVETMPVYDAMTGELAEPQLTAQ